MGLKKRTKVESEFNMSSLTDIIFLLLIFFMLTSTVVAPNALNLKLPGTSKTKVVTPRNIDDVKIDKSGRFYLNGKRIDVTALEPELQSKASRKSGSLDITISPDPEAPTEYVVTVMDICMRNNINGILATDFND